MKLGILLRISYIEKKNGIYIETSEKPQTKKNLTLFQLIFFHGFHLFLHSFPSNLEIFKRII